jgi:DNA polymerase-3 subunit gamma/tau
MRDAISLLDQLASAGDNITLGLAQDVLGTATSQAVISVVEAVINRQSAQGLDVIHRSLDSGSDPRQFARQIIDYLRNLLLVAMGNASQVEATPETRSQMAQHAQAFTVPDLLRIVQFFNQAATETRSGWQPALPLEMAFISAITVESPEKGQASTPLKSETPVAATRVNPPEDKSRPVIAAPSSSSPGTAEMSSVDASANQRLNKNWEQLISRIKMQNPKLAGVLNSAKVRVIKGNVLTLGFNGDFYLKTMENPASLELLKNTLKQVMDMDIEIQAVLESGKKSAPPPEVDSDGMVASALRDLGGEIVDIQ